MTLDHVFEKKSDIEEAVSNGLRSKLNDFGYDIDGSPVTDIAPDEKVRTAMNGHLCVDVDIPNIDCSKCTLQIVEFMAAHGLNKDGDYTYHHCAVLQIHANPDKAIDARFPAEKK